MVVIVVVVVVEMAEIAVRSMSPRLRAWLVWEELVLYQSRRYIMVVVIVVLGIVRAVVSRVGHNAGSHDLLQQICFLDCLAL